MAISHSVDFPKNNYAAAVSSSKTQESPNYVAVPGPEGPQGKTGPKGDKGEKGDPGESISGPRGERGFPGKDAKSYMPPYEQGSGWAKYINTSDKMIPIGALKGIDGWVDFWVNGEEKIELYLPEESVGLYIPEARRVNTKGLKIGAQVQLTYDFEVTTMSANTELWCRSIFPESKTASTTFVASLKYQHVYDLTVTHHITVENSSDRFSGIVPQLRSDLDAIVKIKSISVSVS
jgi:hypothetical protein